ncbi:MAG: hypothetical protein IJ247_02080 [Bacilli bacterium]|nr:hypothetical protein [Bacilli bacterium]
MYLREGLLNEDEIISSLNNKTIESLSNNMKRVMRDLYGVLDNDSVVKCHKPDETTGKPDMIIDYENRKRFVTIKHGHAETVHSEKISTFIDFISSFGISKGTIETLLLFHYGDGTLDGTGETRMNYREVMNSLGDRISLANYELNKNKEFVLSVLDRCMFKGVLNEYQEADSLYFGDKDYGLVATKNQIVKHVKIRSFDFYDNLHIGPLLIKPHSRYSKGYVIDQRSRERIVLYWPHLFADINYISQRYNF